MSITSRISGSKIDRLKRLQSNVGSTISPSKKGTKSPKLRQREEPLPQAVNIEVHERKLTYNDDLSDLHFVELRHFLHKKHRQEAIQAKVLARNIRGNKGSTRGNDDLSQAGIDREILGEMGSSKRDSQSPTTTGRPNLSKAGGIKLQYQTKDKTQCMDNDRYLVTKKVNLGSLPDQANSAQVCDVSKIKVTIERSAQEVHETYVKKIQEMRAKKAQENEARKKCNYLR